MVNLPVTCCKPEGRAKERDSPRVVPSSSSSCGCVRLIVAPLRTAFPATFGRVRHVARARRRRRRIVVVTTTGSASAALVLPITGPADPQPGRVVRLSILLLVLVVITPGRRSPRRRRRRNATVAAVTAVAVAVSTFPLLFPLPLALALVFAIPIPAILTPIPRVPRTIASIIGRFAPRRSSPGGLRTVTGAFAPRSTRTATTTTAIVESFRNGSRVRYAILVLVAVRAGVPSRGISARGSHRRRRRGRRGVTRSGRGLVTAGTSRRRWRTRGGPPSSSTTSTAAGRARRRCAGRSRTGRRRTRRNRRSGVVGRRRRWLQAGREARETSSASSEGVGSLRSPRLFLRVRNRQ